MTDLFAFAEYLDLNQSRCRLIAERRRAEYAHAKREKVERELRATVRRMLEMENAGRVAA